MPVWKTSSPATTPGAPLPSPRTSVPSARTNSPSMILAIWHLPGLHLIQLVRILQETDPLRLGDGAQALTLRLHPPLTPMNAAAPAGPCVIASRAFPL